jgi:hypothetical protein
VAYSKRFGLTPLRQTIVRAEIVDVLGDGRPETMTPAPIA